MTKTTVRSEPRDLVFEIGTEELPATNLAELFENASERTENPLLTKWKQLFADQRIVVGETRVWATSRRLIFFASGVAPAQEKKDLMIKLMAQSEAYADGKPTEKFLTILKHRNTDIAETVVEGFQGKDFVFIKRSQPSRKTPAVLTEVLDSFVRSLGFPKNMKWDAGGLFFPRPIRHVLCLYGHEVIKFRLGRLRSSDRVWFFVKGKRASAVVSNPEQYFRMLKKQGVLYDPAERKETVKTLLGQLARSAGGRLYEDPFLLNEVNYLVEDPDGIAAPFHQEFLKLPLEVLTVSMARKQRIFGLTGKDGKVLPKFLAILDGKTVEKDKRAISLNYENILHAKLQDSLFFYREDLKVPLEKKREELKNLIFLKGAGSMLQKSERLEKLSDVLASETKLSGEHLRSLKRACHLAKADLLTQMVGEFPELQGVIGKYYAAENGEADEVAAAIGEQYLPRTVQDKIPSSPVGAYLSVFDKADLIAACFSLGLEPTSSLDPYGLRRSAMAILKILLEHRSELSIETLLDRTYASLAEQGFTSSKKDEVMKKLKAFFRDRFKALLADRGYREDLVEAALASNFERPYEVWRRVEVLAGLSKDASFLNACKVVERTSNILKGNREMLPEKPTRGLYVEILETALHDKLEQSEQAIVRAKRSGDFAQATSLYAEAFFDILNEFFDKVFINAEDLNVRKNRLSLLKAIKELYTNDIADLSKIQNPSVV